MGGFSLKLKTKQGQHVVSTLTADEKISILKSKISELTKLPAEGITVLVGFPPKPLDLSANESTISSTGIINGDTLIVEEKTQMPDVVPQQHRNNLQLEEDILLAQRLANEGDEALNSSQGILLKQVVPSDNSCLFTSIGMVLLCSFSTICVQC